MKNTLKFELKKVKRERYAEFDAVFLKELDNHAPLTIKKFLRHSNYPFMRKDVRRQIMVRPKLRETTLTTIETMKAINVKAIFA